MWLVAYCTGQHKSKGSIPGASQWVGRGAGFTAP